MIWYWVAMLAFVLVGVTLHGSGLLRFGAGVHWSVWIIMALVLLGGGWMAFDAVHAFVTGDYVTAREGPFAGQLGPWASVVQTVGIDPRSALMKLLMLAYGTTYVAVATALARGIPRAWNATFAVALLGLWYLPFGTLINLVVLLILLLSPLRRLRLSAGC